MTINFNWHVFSSRGRKVEARMYVPKKDEGILLLFCPGFTGAGGTLFEQRHLVALLDNNISCVVLRHGGTRLDTDAGAFVVNCERRMAYAEAHEQTHIGDGPSTVSDWLYEPLVVLDEVAKKYTRIVVIGSSFGIVPALWSLSQLDAPVESVMEVISTAGMLGTIGQGDEDIMRLWTPDFLDSHMVQETLTLKDSTAETIGFIREAYEELPYRAVDLPAHIRLTYLVAENDELVKIDDVRRFYEATGRRGEIITEGFDHAHPRHGMSAHDMADYPTTFLLDRVKKAVRKY